MDKKIFPDEPEIPILPNLFTAGNLVCGFFAILTIFEGINQADSDAVAAFSYYQNATFLIFAACLFDLFDGRIARMRGQDGPFGREFDSLADIVSFGIAPALLKKEAQKLASAARQYATELARAEIYNEDERAFVSRIADHVDGQARWLFDLAGEASRFKAGDF